jgi:hypothetical protein
MEDRKVLCDLAVVGYSKMSSTFSTSFAFYGYPICSGYRVWLSRASKVIVQCSLFSFTISDFFLTSPNFQYQKKWGKKKPFCSQITITPSAPKKGETQNTVNIFIL